MPPARTNTRQRQAAGNFKKQVKRLHKRPKDTPRENCRASAAGKAMKIQAIVQQGKLHATNAVAKVTLLLSFFSKIVAAVASEHTEKVYLFPVTTTQGQYWSSTIQVEYSETCTMRPPVGPRGIGRLGQVVA